MDWGKLPDLVAVALLVCAFASVARSSQTTVSKLWLIGWILIALHFAAFIAVGVPGLWGTCAFVAGIVALISAGLLFMWAAIPYRGDTSSKWIHWALVGSNLLYVVVLAMGSPAWILICTAILLGALPLLISLLFLPRFKNRWRMTTVFLYCALSVFLLFVQQKPESGPTLALNAVLCTVYLGCGILFWHSYRRATAGAFVTIAGFFAWASVFLVSPLMTAFYPQVHLDPEMWNLPKYVVAVGMILMLLEEQIDHNKYLALHDELTGLPNRRLFQDRLANAVERARRTGTPAALLVIDLNRFKEVNDTLGHHAGDRVLQHVAEVFTKRMRRSDTVARTGGDEFSVILEEPTNLAEAENVVLSLMDLLAVPIPIDDCSVQIGASVGIAICPNDAMDIESLCKVADMRMYGRKYGSVDDHQELIRSRSAARPVIGSAKTNPSLQLSPEEQGN